jgi:hypothetical protein
MTPHPISDKKVLNKAAGAAFSASFVQSHDGGRALYPGVIQF